MKTNKVFSDDSPPPVARMPPGYEEVPIHEPDLNKRPVRSALKGAKIRDHFRQQLEEKMLQRQLSGSSLQADKQPPRTAPKPRIRYVHALITLLVSTL